MAFDDDLSIPGLVPRGTGPAAVRGMDDAEAMRNFEWQESRKRRDGHFNVFVPGFGPGGTLQLLLPSPLPTSRYVFTDGVPREEFSPGVLDDPEIAALRDRILSSFQMVGTEGVLARVTVDLCLLEYSSRVIRKNYDVSDDDLTYLHTGTRWIGPMVQHAVGGPEGVRRLSELARQNAPDVPVDVPGVPTREIDRQTAQRGRWHDVVARAKRSASQFARRLRDR